MLFMPLVLNKLIYGGDNSGRGPSGNVWKDCPADICDPNIGRAMFDDFLMGPHSLTSAAANMGYYGYLDTSNTALLLATDCNGVMRLLTDATDNDSPALQAGSGAAGFAKIVGGRTGKRMWFETRVRCNSVTDCGMFVGLGEEGFPADGWMTDDDAVMVDKDFIGFHTLTATPTEIDIQHKKAGQTQQITGEAAATLVVSTWTKFGITYDPQAGSEGIVKFWINGVEYISARVTDTNAATFPDGEEMAPLWGFKNGTAASRTMDIDWWAFAQEND